MIICKYILSSYLGKLTVYKFAYIIPLIIPLDPNLISWKICKLGSYLTFPLYVGISVNHVVQIYFG